MTKFEKRFVYFKLNNLKLIKNSKFKIKNYG